MTTSISGLARDDALLLATKLYVPRTRPTLLPRPRLLDRLDAGRDGPLTLISAPTGAGKTALLATWISDRYHRPGEQPGEGEPVVAWLSLDAGDDTPRQFLRYLVAACRMLAPSAGATVAALLQDALTPLPPLPALLTPLINDLAQLPTRGMLVLDDLHVLRDARIYEAIGFLIEHLPPQLHVVITSRVDPPLPLPRWRAHGLLTELRAADLRFSVEEAAAFLTEVMRLPLSAADVTALEQRTEGWIAGLQFAALAMRDRADLAGFVQAFTGSHRFVLDYLVDEVLLRQPPETQAFLLHTSILGRLCGPLCDALLAAAPSPASSGGAANDGQARLEQLEQANLFVVPLDDARQWYRYHHLFADVLRHRLASSVPPDEVRRLHIAAAAWFEQRDLIADALPHSLQGADHERYARLVEQVGRQFLSRGDPGLLQRWLAHVPTELLASRPRLSLDAAWALSFTADLDAVAARLDDVERRLTDGGAEPDLIGVRDDLAGDLLALRGFVAFRRHQLPEAIARLEAAQARLPATDRHMRGMNLHHLGLAYRLSHDLSAAERTFAEAVSHFDSTAETRGYAVYPLKNLGMIEEARGRLRRAEQLYRAALEHAMVGGRPLPSAGHALLCLGRLHYEWNDLATATGELRQAIELGQQGELHQIVAEAAIELAPVLLAQGAGDEVEQVLAQAQAAAQRWNDPGLIERAAAAAARVRLRQGQPGMAQPWAADLQADRDTPAEHDLRQLTLARLLLAQDQHDAARQLLERLVEQAEADGRLRSAVEALALLALSEAALSDDARAVATLEQALRRAAPEGYVRTFVDAGPAMADLLERGLRRRAWRAPSGDESPTVLSYARRLLDSFPVRTAAGNREASAPAPAPADVEPLTPRELEVLRLIAAGHSNSEIAATMVVAMSTVKAHINNLFSKLGVSSRTQALVRARERGLL